MKPQRLDESLYRKIKENLKEAIERVRAEVPEAGEYLEEHLIFDDEERTVMYTGDDRIKITPIIHRDTSGEANQN